MSFPQRNLEKRTFLPPSATPAVDSNLLVAVISASFAAAATSLLTYPFESLKVGQQLYIAAPNDPLVFPSPLSRWFTGLSALVVGNVAKAATRIVVYNQALAFMANDHGKTSAPRVVVAALMLGLVELLWIIPFENIKTLMVHNAYLSSAREAAAARAGLGVSVFLEPSVKEYVAGFERKHQGVNKLTPRQEVLVKWFKQPSGGFTEAVKELYQTRGIHGFVQGSGITLARQAANATILFSSYHALSGWMTPSGNQDSAVTPVVAGGFAAAATVAFTQPLDTVKLRVQSRYVYRSSLDAAWSVVSNEGFLKLWAGWMPRLVKFGVSGGLSLSMYQWMSVGLGGVAGKKVFAEE